MSELEPLKHKGFKISSHEFIQLNPISKPAEIGKTYTGVFVAGDSKHLIQAVLSDGQNKYIQYIRHERVALNPSGADLLKNPNKNVSVKYAYDKVAFVTEERERGSAVVSGLQKNSLSKF
ncbi:hypothetical protein [Xanthomonas albilineans]|uniref:hypothetical protein n=1 Tax=Xanthomonas albilineans TaxID=29447 RepID=UPI000AA03BAB|nr:hypothetical protein [Xanthomonas albilineans]